MNKFFDFDRFVKRQTIIFSPTEYERLIEIAAQENISLSGLLVQLCDRGMQADPNYETAKAIALQILAFNPAAHCRGRRRSKVEQKPKMHRPPRKDRRTIAPLPVTMNAIAVVLAFGYGVPLRDFLKGLVLEFMQNSDATN